jgi:hypothetical protein
LTSLSVSSFEEVVSCCLLDLSTYFFSLFSAATKGGYRIEILLNATTRRNEHGTIIGMIGIGQDITARITQDLARVKAK